MTCGWYMWMCPSGVVLKFHFKYIVGYPRLEMCIFCYGQRIGHRCCAGLGMWVGSRPF